ncbi:MAG: allantoinase AllB [Flavisolibacter sp.]
MSTGAIYSKRCWLDNELKEATVFFDQGLITKVIEGQRRHFENIYNAGTRVLMPGVVDAHVHVNEPGRTDWEGFETATMAAAAGGTTTIIDMPLNASPVTTTKAALEKKLEAAAKNLHVNCGFYGGLVPGNYNELESLIGAGVLGIKAFLTDSGIDEFPNVGRKELEEAMPLLEQYHIPLLVHCELDDDVQVQQGNPVSYQNYLASRPRSWENNAVAMMVDLCRKYRCQVHIVHVSSAEVLSMIEQAKQEGLPLTAETCPHYIFFHAEEIPDANCLFKCAPPIREEANNILLKHALKNDTLDFLASDHSPAPVAMKELHSGNLQKAWGGIAGLQFLLSASWTALKETMSLNQLIPLVTEHPARFLRIDSSKGFIKEGHDADFVIWSPEESFPVKEDMTFHKHKISPYVSRKVFGKVHSTYVNGNLVFNEGQIIKKNSGKWLLRK